MCSDPDSRPPLEAVPGADVAGWHTELRASDGNTLAAFRADSGTGVGDGIIVLPDYYGLTPFYEALAMRFAEVGVDAVAIDYYGRTASAPPRDPSFDHVAHSRRTSWAGVQADVAAAAAALRTERGVERLFSIGFCFGGRSSFLLGTVSELAMSGVIGFYGWPVGDFANDAPAPADVADGLRAPLLAVFGGADTKIPTTDVAAFRQALRQAPIQSRVCIYEDAPHSFFDRAYAGHKNAALAAWDEVRAFIEAPTSI